MAEQQVISITTEYIKLEALLKLANLVGRGGGQGPHPGGPGLCQRGRVYHGERSSAQGTVSPSRGGSSWCNEGLLHLSGRLSQLYPVFCSVFPLGSTSSGGKRPGKDQPAGGHRLSGRGPVPSGPGDKELIAFQRTQGTITAQVESRGRDFLSSRPSCFRGARRKLFVNHVKLKTAGELSEILQTVLFCPEDLALIKAGAAERRTFLTGPSASSGPGMPRPCPSTKIAGPQTRILRDWEKNPSLLEVLEDFNEAMARAGALVIHYRAHFIRKLAEKAQVIQREFSGGGE